MPTENAQMTPRHTTCIGDRTAKINAQCHMYSNLKHTVQSSKQDEPVEFRYVGKPNRCSPCRYITLQDLLKQVIQGLVGVGDEQGALARAVVVQHMHDLHCCICFACSRGPYHHGQPRLHSRLDGFHLCGYAHTSGNAISTERKPAALGCITKALLC